MEDEKDYLISSIEYMKRGYMDKMINLLIIIGVCLETFIYMVMLIKVIYLKFIKNYKYLSLTNILDKLAVVVWVLSLIGGIILAIDGNNTIFLSALLMGFLCYSPVSSILCFENDERIFIRGRMLVKFQTYISNKEYKIRSNIVLLKSEKNVISIWVSSSGKDALYARFGDRESHK